MLFDGLPIELERHILIYDSTYVEFFRKEVIPELMEMAWKRITFKFFTGSFELDFFMEDLETVYELVSDLEEDAEELEVVLFLQDDA